MGRVDVEGCVREDGVPLGGKVMSRERDGSENIWRVFGRDTNGLFVSTGPISNVVNLVLLSDCVYS